MTDPFKNQRYSEFSSASAALPPLSPPKYDYVYGRPSYEAASSSDMLANAAQPGAQVGKLR